LLGTSLAICVGLKSLRICTEIVLAENVEKECFCKWLKEFTQIFSSGYKNVCSTTNAKNTLFKRAPETYMYKEKQFWLLELSDENMSKEEV
jgi:hypothetical protein